MFELFDVGMYADPDSTGVAPPFVLPSYDDDLMACQRYYQKIGNLVVVDATNLDYPSWAFHTMRTTPTITATYGNGTGAAFVLSHDSLYQSVAHSAISTLAAELFARM